MITAKKIREAFNQTKTDKGFTHNYETGYEFVFKNHTPSNLLEIGINEGRSLAAWKILFPECQITGVDISTKHFINEYIQLSESKIIIGDSTKKNILGQLDNMYDIIIDDGSHFYLDIIDTFDNFKDRFKYAYVIEDSMFATDFLVAYARSLGFIVTRFPSPKKNIPVNTGILTKRKYGPKDITTVVSLEQIVIQFPPTQT